MATALVREPRLGDGEGLAHTFLDMAEYYAALTTNTVYARTFDGSVGGARRGPGLR